MVLLLSAGESLKLFLTVNQKLFERAGLLGDEMGALKKVQTKEVQKEKGLNYLNCLAFGLTSGKDLLGLGSDCSNYLPLENFPFKNQNFFPNLFSYKASSI